MCNQADRKLTLQVCRGRKFFMTELLVLATNSENLGASWSQCFFLKVKPWYCTICAIFIFQTTD